MISSRMDRRETKQQQDFALLALQMRMGDGGAAEKSRKISE